MAETAIFSFASNVLSKIATPTFEKAFEGACTIWNARDDLDKLKRTIQTIQAVLLDAERKQERSAAVRDWIMRVREVLYDADDLFNEVATEDLLKQEIKGSILLKKVLVCFSNLNPIVSNNSIAMRVKTIRKSLLEISTDMAALSFVSCDVEKGYLERDGLRLGQDPGSFVDSKDVIGRDDDKKVILEMLFSESDDSKLDVPVVIAIVGIAGMGKTTLAQLIYNHNEVQTHFEKMWFACISDTSDDKHVYSKIAQSMDKEVRNYGDFTIDQLQSNIRESMQGINRFLLVLDDVWDDDHGRWQARMRLIGRAAKGSMIIVTTRSLSVARAVDAMKIHNLNGLSENESWDLFKSVAFTVEQVNDTRWVALGREIVRKCANVPLAIKSIGSLLYSRPTFEEWEYFRNTEISKLAQSGEASVMSILKLSYDHLPSNLKQCFAYCSVFPKEYIISKQEMIFLWIAQGFIQPNNENHTVEAVGHSYFMTLLRRSFFQAMTTSYGTGDVETCKMHDLIHDLAQHVAGGDSIVLTSSSSSTSKCTRHASVGYATNVDSRATLKPLLKVNWLRSLLFMEGGSICSLSLNEQFTNLKLLRALSLRNMEIEKLPSSIGELKHLRYLDLSETTLKELPDSITKLLNLQILNILLCEELEALPNDFRKLINLRRLDIRGCYSLKHMPPGFGELTSLRYLDEFKVGNGTGLVQRSNLDAFHGLVRLMGRVMIEFKDDTDDWDGVACWKPPISLQELHIRSYKGVIIPHWGNGRVHNPSLWPKLTSLSLEDCSRVKCLPPFRHLPYLMHLSLDNMKKLEYVEDESPTVETSSSTALYLCHLEHLKFFGLPKLKGWSRNVDNLLSLTCLSTIRMDRCGEIKSMPLCPNLQTLKLELVNAKVLPPLLSSKSLKDVSINFCNELTSFPGKSLTSLQTLSILYCQRLKYLELPPSECNMVEDLSLLYHTDLELWEESKKGVNWDSLRNICRLRVDRAPSSETLPDCLRHLQALGRLTIIDENGTIS